MPATVVVGGQYGSEGKGKVVALIASTRSIACAVRCGGPNSGHSTSANGKPIVLRQLPASAGQNDHLLAISAGAVVDVEVLANEIAELGLDRNRIVVDPRAAIVTEADKLAEQQLAKDIGSTSSGNGSALMRRMSRSNATLAGQCEELKRIARVESVAPILHELLDKKQEIVIEGTQGFGLSLLHGPHYPYVTSKDTTAAAFAMEAGISPLDVSEIVLVIRTFPIRVGGASGPLDDEISWETIMQESGAPAVEPEFTSVTQKLRRVARFDIDLVKAAVAYNRPTAIAVMGIDRLDYVNRGIRSSTDLTEVAFRFLENLEAALDVRVCWIGTGFGTFEAVGGIRGMHGATAHA
ncbi:adenylosuccinate synthetase [Pirellulaceae bacterium SH501]